MTTDKAEKIDIYTKVTDRIVADMERGELPWNAPWKACGTMRLPARWNGETYNGINILILWAEMIDKSYDSNTWMTFNQARELGGHVRKGEKGTQVVYASKFTKEVEGDDGETIRQSIPFLKTYTVFNVTQIDELPAKYQPVDPGEPLAMDDRREMIDQFFGNLGADLRFAGNQAFYHPGLDFVQVPVYERFTSLEGYASTLGHEFIHWTRHASRLNRSFNQNRFGDDGYAMEELVAEMGAAFLMAYLGVTVEPREDHAAYLQSWLKVLKSDKRAIFTAASYASKAVEFLQGFQPIEAKSDSVSEQTAELATA